MYLCGVCGMCVCSMCVWYVCVCGVCVCGICVCVVFVCGMCVCVCCVQVVIRHESCDVKDSVKKTLQLVDCLKLFVQKETLSKDNAW